MIDPNDLRNIVRKPPLWMVLLAMFGLYFSLIIPTLDRLGIGWDEATDLLISRTYMSRSGLLFGSSLDPSQTRLPMFVGALVFRLLGTSSLMIARFTTVVVGGLTLLGVYFLGKEQFNHKTGLLAVGLLAINPFFLSFARLSFTESDVYLACALVWWLVSLVRLKKTNLLGYAALSGILLGLSISSKATVLVILLGLPGVLVFWYISRRTIDLPKSEIVNSMPAISIYRWAGVAIIILATGIFLSKHLNAGDFHKIIHLLNYALVWLGWLVTFAWAIRFRRHTAQPIPLFVYMAALALFTFVVFPPEHLVNSSIVQGLVSRARTEITFSFFFVMEVAAMHLFAIILKSTPLLGLGLIAGFLGSLTQLRRPEITLPLLIVVIYGMGILLLPLAQPFYTIPILPILSLLTADQLLRLYSQRRKLSLILIIAGLIWWGIEVKQCYPDYHLNGYQWLGARPFFGRSSIGYRSIVYVPSDGVQQAMEWLNENATEGQVAQLYVGPWHIVKSMAPNPVYELTDGFEKTLEAKPDYIVIHIGEIIWQGEGRDDTQGSIFRYPFDPEVLYKEYEQVLVIRRAFDLEVASVWKRK